MRTVSVTKFAAFQSVNRLRQALSLVLDRCDGSGDALFTAIAIVPTSVGAIVAPVIGMRRSFQSGTQGLRQICELRFADTIEAVGARPAVAQLVPNLALLQTAAIRMRLFLAALGRRTLLWAAAAERER